MIPWTLVARRAAIVFGVAAYAGALGAIPLHAQALESRTTSFRAIALDASGEEIFRAACMTCHGPDGKGLREFGGPNLTDQIWLYGGDKDTLRATITKSRYGVMPRWNNRLDPVTIKMLAAFVHSLGGGEASPAPKAATNVQP